jgi:signal transduction histidine kinase
VKGSGLGLSIVKTIVIMHGASIELASSPLGGLRVSVQFSQGQMPNRHFLDSNLAALHEAGHEGP